MHRPTSQLVPPSTSSIPNKSVQQRVLDDPDFDTEVELPPLEAVIPKELLRKLKPKEKERQKVINGSLLSQFTLSSNWNDVLCCRPILICCDCNILRFI